MTLHFPKAELSKVMAHVEHMRLNFPDRKSGTGPDFAAAQYVVEQMESFGLEAALQPFETYDSDIGTSFIALGSKDGTEIASLPCLHVEPTDPEGALVELVDVGPGGLADYEGKDVRGKAVLAEVSYAPATPEKARIAASKGATAIILMNWGTDDSTEIPWRGLKSVWGNPTPESVVEMPRLPGISISRHDGLMLRQKLVDEGDIQLYVHLTATRAWRTLNQPVSWLMAPEGAPERDRFVVVSAHVDSWNPGVTDNITGMSVIMEMARTLAAQRETLKRSVVFCCWNGHEVAEAAGSTYFVDSHWERINRNAIAYLNVDSVGMKGTEEFHVNCSPELHRLAEDVTKDVYAGSLTTSITPLRRVGDQSFFGIGVPAVTGRHMFTADVIQKHNGATLGWFNHTGFDTIEVLDEEVLGWDLKWNAALLLRLVTDSALPYCFSDRLEDMTSRFHKAIDGSSQRSDLERIFIELEALGLEISWLDKAMASERLGTEDLTRLNGVAMRVARQITFLTAASVGKYGQDSYGSSKLLQPVPLLSCLEDYEAAEKRGWDEHLLWTKLIQLRHQITDAIEIARTTIADCRALFEQAGYGKG